MHQPIFEKPDISLAPTDIIAVFTVRDDISRLPWFLDYYRQMGVVKFFAVDNDSKDGTTEFLKAQPDVVYFYTANSYVSSNAGRLWTTELCDHYANGHWCLTLDSDEMLVFPGCEHINLIELCHYMDKHNFEGLFTIFLDMYSDRPLSQSQYKPSTPFLSTCQYFDANVAYQLKVPNLFPPVQIFGGPRQRMFWDQGNKGTGPSMRKLPLIKWHRGFKYHHSTHSTSLIRLADFTGALLHFKFFASFQQLAINEYNRGDRMQMEDYKKYADMVQEQDLYFKTDSSVRYDSSLTLVEHGVIVSNKKIINFVADKIKDNEGRKAKDAFREQALEYQKKAERQSTLILRNLPSVWSIVCHALTELDNFRDQERIPDSHSESPDTRTQPLDTNLKFALAGHLDYINEKYICGWAYNPVNLEEKLTVVIFDHKEYLLQTVADRPNPGFLNPSDRPDGIYFQVPTPEELLGRSNNQIEIKVIPGGICLTEQPISFNGLSDITQSHFDGVCERVENGWVRGWVWDKKNPHASVDISVYIDEQFLFTMSANLERNDLIAIDKGTGQYGFRFQLPSELQRDRTYTLSIRIVNTALHLRKTPVSILNQKSIQ